MFRKVRLITPVGSLLFMVMGCASTSREIRPQIDPQAEQFLKTMSDTLARADRFSFRARELSDEILANGQTVELSNERKILVARPDKLAADSEGDIGKRWVWYDGKELTIFDRPRNIYAKVSVPGTLDRMFDFIFENYELTVPLSDLVFPCPYRVLMENVRSGKYLGRHRVEEWSCHHLVMHQDTIEWQIWIDAGPIAVPRKVLILYTGTPGRPEYSAILDQWNFSPPISPGQFEPILSTGAKRVDMRFLLEIE
jgi:hypothetical protein